MSWNDWRARKGGFRLTHVPTGISVDLWCDNFERRYQSPYNLHLRQVARSWLAAKVWAARQPRPKRKGPVRTYRLGSTEQPTLTWAMLGGEPRC